MLIDDFLTSSANDIGCLPFRHTPGKTLTVIVISKEISKFSRISSDSETEQLSNTSNSLSVAGHVSLGKFFYRPKARFC